MKRFILLFAMAGLACLFTGTAFGNILNVPTAEYQTIQAGIDAATSGDTVQVAAGTYQETITMKSGVTIQGAGQGVSIIDGQEKGHVVTANSVDSAATLDGFTITNGRSFAGGGMYIVDSSPTVSHCTFSGNTASTQIGGGIYNANSSPTVTYCIFSGNSAGKYGGGMANSNNSSPTVTNCTFSGNSAIFIDYSYAGGGGGIFNLTNSSPTVENCTFSGNTAMLGGGIANFDSSSPTVTNCIFSGNPVNYNGGGMANYSSSAPTVTNCTFSANTVNAQGGGMWNSQSSPTLTNCILWNDSPNEISGYSSAPTVTYSDIQGGYSGTGNLMADPMFADSANADFHLTKNSPCIDAGLNSAPALPVTDIDGDDRKIDDPKVVDTGSGIPPIVDMGVDEYVWQVKIIPSVPLLLLDGNN